MVKGSAWEARDDAARVLQVRRQLLFAPEIVAFLNVSHAHSNLLAQRLFRKAAIGGMKRVRTVHNEDPSVCFKKSAV